jgi:hypothetical protein
VARRQDDGDGSCDATVRGHHLLCLLAFSGEGYSEPFEASFGRLAALYRTPGRHLNVVCGPDEACRSCPHLGPGGCRSQADGPEASVVELDTAVLAALRLGPGRHETSRLLSLVRALPDDTLDGLCGRCSWFGRIDCRSKIRTTG